jgi:Ulp1 family protease
MIIVPVHWKDHWSTCVIINPGSISADFSEDTPDDECYVPCFLMLDSLRNYHEKKFIVTHLMKWLNAEYVKENNASATSIFNLWSIKMVTPDG